MSTSELVVLGLGSNEPWNNGTCAMEPRTILGEAISRLKNVLANVRVSSFYLTDPQGVADQPRFLNMALSGLYPSSPESLLREIHTIEAAFGRDRTKERRWGERTLDIDILLFGNAVFSRGNGDIFLEIPHPRLRERRFALEPLLELLPCAVEPGTDIPYEKICAPLRIARNLNFQGLVKISQ